MAKAHICRASVRQRALVQRPQCAPCKSVSSVSYGWHSSSLNSSASISTSSFLLTAASSSLHKTLGVGECAGLSAGSRTHQYGPASAGSTLASAALRAPRPRQRRWAAVSSHDVRTSTQQPPAPPLWLTPCSPPPAAVTHLRPCVAGTRGRSQRLAAEDGVRLTLAHLCGQKQARRRNLARVVRLEAVPRVEAPEERLRTREAVSSGVAQLQRAARRTTAVATTPCRSCSARASCEMYCANTALTAR